MYQIVGILMVFFSCVLFSYEKVRGLKRKYENLKEMQKALFLMKHEISFSARELWEASGALSKLLSGEVADFFGRISSLLAENETLSFGAAWQQAKEGQADLLPRQAEIYMKDFAAQTGTLSRELEGEHLQAAEDALLSMCREEEAQYQKNRKLIYTLGAIGGAAVLILFI